MSLTSYIKQDLIAHISSGQLSSAFLTLDDLSKRYDASITPVRAAIKELIHDGYLHKTKNRRLAVTPRRAQASAVAIAPEQPKDYYKIISDDLVRLSLQGEALVLREETTAKTYGISRSSITKIFSRLAGDGILDHLPRRGWQLRPFRQADLDAYIEIRITLEVKALEIAWPHLVDNDLQVMLDRNRLPEGPDDQPQSDNSLHAYIITKAANPYIAEFFERRGRYYKVLFEWELLDREAKIPTVKQHREILEALLRRDQAAAVQLLTNHIRNNHPVVHRLIANPQAQQPGAAATGPTVAGDASTGNVWLDQFDQSV